MLAEKSTVVPVRSGSGFRFQWLLWGKGLLCVSTQLQGDGTDTVPSSVPEKRF